jgi:hypothetical protein
VAAAHTPTTSTTHAATAAEELREEVEGVTEREATPSHAPAHAAPAELRTRSTTGPAATVLLLRRWTTAALLQSFFAELVCGNGQNAQKQKRQQRTE